MKATVFATFHPFRGVWHAIQRNSIASWTRLPFVDQILLIGSEEGIGGAADEFRDFGVEHVPVPPDQYELGTFSCSLLLELAKSAARNRVLFHISGDVIVRDARVAWRHAVSQGRPFIVARSRQWDRGPLQSPYRIDLMAFTRDTFASWPEVLVGRPRADGMIMRAALDQGAETIDASFYVDAIHQPHEPAVERSLWSQGMEKNKQIADGENASCFEARYVPFVDDPDQIRPTHGPR